MARLAAACAAVALLAVTGVAAAPASAQTAEARYAQQATVATNAHRADEGLAALRTNKCLRRAAVRQATRMAQREQIYHQDLGAVLQECHLSAAGENVAAGYRSGRSVVNDGWMESEGHRANILDPAFTLMGIGARKGHDGRWYVAQVFGRKA
jgi:uncharacterized protein YkwD